ncbi:MAG: ribonucleoside-diphosphate reductase subunit alpha [Richelia sp. RM2_1_2]|nr:ribonucleoside-diphosphate reductase subunit alpha [Richelia sp. RM2_1_2]
MTQTDSITIVKRDGTKVPVDYEKINKVLIWATEGINNVSASDIAMNANLQLFNGIKTEDIHKVLIQSAASLIKEDTSNYQFVAANLSNYLLRKQVFQSAGDNLPSLNDVIKRNVKAGVYDKIVLEKYNEDDLDKLNSYLRHQRDFNFVYAGLQQLIDKYLLKDRKTHRIYETPQFMYMLIAMTLFADETNDRLQKVRSFYNDISNFKISLPTPIMSGVRTPNRQYSSCTLIDVGDSLESIGHSDLATMYYTSKRAGIGLNFGRIRAIGDKIRNGEVIHTGVIPFLKKFESTTKSCTQNGIRGGASTTHFPYWHKEISDILVLKNNKGTDDNRVRKMDYSIQFNRLFYKRFVENKDITLFSPGDVPDLYEVFASGDNDAFEKLYEEYEAKKKISTKKIKARDLMNVFAQERIETGRMYVMNMDHVNNHSSFLRTVYMSNLCQEITLPTIPIKHIESLYDSEGEIALCVLSAVNVGELKSLKELEGICKNIVSSLDYVIDNQDYPVEAAKKMLKRRSIGVGITNLAHYLAKNDVTYDDPNALPLVDVLMEHFQYYLLKASCELAQEKGACELFYETKYSKGILPIDTYVKDIDGLIKRKLTLDWEGLRADILKYGLRNSTLSAQMPCESSSLTTNSTNGIEPVRSLITAKVSKQGVLRQVVPDIVKLKNKYQLAFDMVDNRGITNICAVMQKYMDQSISTNHYYDYSKYPDNQLPLSVIIKDIMYSYKMGLKTLYYANTNDASTDDMGENMKDVNCESGACSI